MHALSDLLREDCSHRCGLVSLSPNFANLCKARFNMRCVLASARAVWPYAREQWHKVNTFFAALRVTADPAPRLTLMELVGGSALKSASELPSFVRSQSLHVSRSSWQEARELLQSAAQELARLDLQEHSHAAELWRRWSPGMVGSQLFCSEGLDSRALYLQPLLRISGKSNAPQWQRPQFEARQLRRTMLSLPDAHVSLNGVR
eukprot:1021750-Amphidinium_carterae.1